MNQQDAFALGLILGQQDGQQDTERVERQGADEASLASLAEGDSPDDPEQFIINTTGFAASRPFPLKDNTGRSLPVEGPGTLVSALAVAQSKAFDVVIEVDNQEVINDSFADLQTISAELERVSAYEREDGTFVLHVTDYEFQSAYTTEIHPRERITFERIRVEADLAR